MTDGNKCFSCQITNCTVDFPSTNPYYLSVKILHLYVNETILFIINLFTIFAKLDINDIGL